MWILFIFSQSDTLRRLISRTLKHSTLLYLRSKFNISFKSIKRFNFFNINQLELIIDLSY